MGNKRHIVIEGNLGHEMFVEDANGGFTAFFKDFPKVISQGETLEEAQENLWKTMYDVMQYLFKQKEKFEDK